MRCLPACAHHRRDEVLRVGDAAAGSVVCKSGRATDHFVGFTGDSMTVELTAIHIYSHDGQSRSVLFHAGLNIITGKKKTGKSAIIDIVDYCLGRGSCYVAEPEALCAARRGEVQILFLEKRKGHRADDRLRAGPSFR
jgi:hypothetical protein